MGERGGGWVPASVEDTETTGASSSREQRRWGAGSRIRLHGGRLSAGGRDGSPHPRKKRVGEREEGWWGWGGGDGFPHPFSRGQVLRGGTGMGPRIREDNGGGVPGEREGGRMVDWMALRGGALRGNNGGGGGGGDGFPHPFSRGQVLRGGTGMGPRIREDNGGRLFAGTTEAGSRVGMGSRIRLHGGGLSVGGHGRVHPHPNLPPEGGRERRGMVGSLRFYGGGHSAGTMWMGERGGRFANRRLRERQGGRVVCGQGWGRDGVAAYAGVGWVPAYARTTDGGEGGRMVGRWRCGRDGF